MNGEQLPRIERIRCAELRIVPIELVFPDAETVCDFRQGIAAAHGIGFRRGKNQQLLTDRETVGIGKSVVFDDFHRRDGIFSRDFENGISAFHGVQYHSFFLSFLSVLLYARLYDSVIFCPYSEKSGDVPARVPSRITKRKGRR